jgi:hypothetical protein
MNSLKLAYKLLYGTPPPPPKPTGTTNTPPPPPPKPTGTTNTPPPLPPKPTGTTNTPNTTNTPPFDADAKWEIEKEDPEGFKPTKYLDDNGNIITPSI